ncbi:hypothetical protein HD597_011270 [Nonomuraea thailandensis]|uniref:Uncharacterized protein n=1 Tax=Nonomuraea thailandensis TaxID=1188745 RepID=A0A9X2GUQ9_9ACTN|nr:hypothetical protein [Nonomuraea thailandensis]MCP2364250.1 hypothetical protein [Nonomuraea thailandensis]
MAATITTGSIPAVLRRAADLVAGLPHARVVRSEVHRALRHASPQSDIAQAALVALVRHLRALSEVEWLTRASQPRSRDQVSVELRVAADAFEAAQAELDRRNATGDGITP